MSTRCVIEIKNGSKKVMLYHHHDGYIEGVGYDLLKRFWLTEGRYFKNKYGSVYADMIVNELIKDKDDEYEFTYGIHTDIEYYYVIDVKKQTLVGYQAHYTSNCQLVIDRTYSMTDIEEAHKKQQAKYDKWEKSKRTCAVCYVKTEKFRKVSNSLKPIIVDYTNIEEYYNILSQDEIEMVSYGIVNFLLLFNDDSI